MMVAASIKYVIHMLDMRREGRWDNKVTVHRLISGHRETGELNVLGVVQNTAVHSVKVSWTHICLQGTYVFYLQLVTDLFQVDSL